MIRRCTTWSFLALVFGVPVFVYAQTEDVVYFHTDAVGSVRLVTDANGQVVERYDYLPFGEPWPVSPSGNETRRFTGQERDLETGFDYFGARQYASGSGRFTRPDDPGYADLLNPQSMNLYAYANNNPLRYVDPTGHDGDCLYGYDSSAGLCMGLDMGTVRFWWESLSRSLSTGPLVPQMPALGAPDPTCLAAARNTGIGIGGVVGGYVGATGGVLTGGLGGSAVAPGPGTLGGAYMGGTTGFGIGSASGTLTGGILGTAFGNIFCASGSGGGGGGNTDHGAGRLSSRGFTEADIANTKTGRMLKQADGATVYLKEVAPGRFNVIVEGERGIITAMKNLDRRALANLARNYGWNW